jgi:hypothetical protein
VIDPDKGLSHFLQPIRLVMVPPELTVTNKNPQQLNFPVALWTAAMCMLIANGYDFRLRHSSVCRQQFGPTTRRQLWRMYQQDATEAAR